MTQVIRDGGKVRRFPKMAQSMRQGSDATDVFDDDFRLGDLVPAALLSGAVLFSIAIANLLMAEARGQYIVVLPGSYGQIGAIELVYRSQGGVAGFGVLSNIVLAFSDDPDFPAAMRAAGAWFVLPAPLLPGCISTPQESIR